MHNYDYHLIGVFIIQGSINKQNSNFSLDYALLIMNYELKEVVPGRLELPTSTLSVWRSDQLSYRTVVCS